MSIYPNALALLQAGGPSIMLVVIIYLGRSFRSNRRLALLAPAILATTVLLLAPAPGLAQAPPQPGGEAHLILPDLNQGTFLGTSGRTLTLCSANFQRQRRLFSARGKLDASRRTSRSSHVRRTVP